MKEKLIEILREHDLRRWARVMEGNGTFDYLRCCCGYKEREDSNEKMLEHVAEKLLEVLK